MIKEPHEEVLDLLYEALGKTKALPFMQYEAARVIGAMINIETTIDSLENAKKADN